MDWGIDGSGYFYLSYYDQSIVSAETFDYDINSIDSEAESYYNNTYDYLPISTSFNETSSDKISTANVFAAEGDQTVRTLACETTLPNTTVTYELYKLNENHSNPTDGYRVAEITKTYEYGRFHRVDLTEEQQFKVPQGSTFSVVVTQKSGDNYYYTLDGEYNEAYVDMYNGILEEQYTRVVEQIAQAAFASEYGHAYVEGSSEEEDAAMQAFRDGAWQLLELFGQISYVEKNSTRTYLQEVPLNIAHNNGGHIHELCATPSLFTCKRGFIGVFFASCLFLKTNFEQYSHSHLGNVRFIRAKHLPEVMNRPYVRINHKNIERT